MKRLDLQPFVLINSTIGLSLNGYRRKRVIVRIK
jgi:hypothetical protein